MILLILLTKINRLHASMNLNHRPCSRKLNATASQGPKVVVLVRIPKINLVQCGPFQSGQRYDHLPILC